MLGLLILTSMLAGATPTGLSPGEVGLFFDPRGELSAHRVERPGPGMSIEVNLYVLLDSIPGGMDYYEFSVLPWADDLPGVSLVSADAEHPNPESCPELMDYWCRSNDPSCYGDVGLEIVSVQTYRITHDVDLGTLRLCMSGPTYFAAFNPAIPAYVRCGESFFEVLPMPLSNNGCAELQIISSVSGLQQSWGVLKRNFRP